MAITQRKCDACKAVYDVYNGTAIDKDYGRHNSIMLANVYSHEPDYDYTNPIDLCPDCMHKVINILKGGQ